MLSTTLTLLVTVSSEYVNSIVSGHARVLSSHAITVSVDAVEDLSPVEEPEVDDSVDDSADDSGLASDSSLMGTSNGGSAEGESPIIVFPSYTLAVGDVSSEATEGLNEGEEGISTVGDIVVEVSGESNVGAGDDDRLSKVGAIVGGAAGELTVGDEGLLSSIPVVKGVSESLPTSPPPVGGLGDADAVELLSFSPTVGFCAIVEDEGLSPSSSTEGSLGDSDAEAKSPYPSTVGEFEESKPEEVGNVGMFSLSVAPVGEFGMATVGLNTKAGVGGDDEGVTLSLSLSPSLSPPPIKSFSSSFSEGTELILLVDGCVVAIGPSVMAGVDTGDVTSSLSSLPITDAEP